MSVDSVTQLYPVMQPELKLQGLYLQLLADDAREAGTPLVYTNYISSLDGRIAIDHPVSGERGVPGHITNPRDWRLYQELAAGADVLLVSARYLRELSLGKAQASLPVSDDPAFADLLEWRLQQGFKPQPAVVVLSASLDLPLSQLQALQHRGVYVATGAKHSASADRVQEIEQCGAHMLYAGDDSRVEGGRLVELLTGEGFRNIYSIAGPGVLETLVRAQVLDRIYLTQANRLIGGVSFDTLFEGHLLNPPADFSLRALYYDQHAGDSFAQLFGIYDLIHK
ncbi:MAG TPA: dihydrofolate reductase family protein [Gammaproteobacteria bacterium]